VLSWNLEQVLKKNPPPGLYLVSRFCLPWASEGDASLLFLGNMFHKIDRFPLSQPYILTAGAPVIIRGGGCGGGIAEGLCSGGFDSFVVKPEGTGHLDSPGSLRLVTTEPLPPAVQHHWYLLE
jgi:hypothetical protein